MKNNTWKKIFAITGVMLTPVIFCTLIVAAAIMAIVSGTAAGSQSVYPQAGALSDSVLAYQSAAAEYCSQFGIPGYAPLVLAVMQQESGGSGNDPMQCSECFLNDRYPKKPESIADPAYSVRIGTEYLASCIKAAKCKSPSDVSGISLALQGYNFGGGYIRWALERGGYSHINAAEFSRIMARREGWKNYGDTDYVPHVLRYYIQPSNGSFAVPLRTGTYRISRGYGYDSSNGEFHKGIDYAAPAGTNIYASAAGTVSYAQFGRAPYGGYGNVVVIQHSGNVMTLYGHCSKILVRVGQKVQQGEIIALVGSTGHSTGNHCHFEMRVNNVAVNPGTYLIKNGAK
jgi:hypothetical protein